VIYQAESFNSAFATTAGNSGGACTNNGNANGDIQGTTDAGGGCNVGWIIQGGWQNWTTVSRTVTLNAGTYNLGGVRADRGMELQLDRSCVGGRRPEPGVER